MDRQAPALSPVAQEVLRLLVDSRTGATATQLAAQLAVEKEQVLEALLELAGRGHVRRHGRRWRA